MCGLFAGTGKLSSTRITALGSMNESRGIDSVGIAWLDKETLRVAKIAERPIAALNLTLRKEVTEAAISGLFIGHTRQATQGKVCAENAHPFLDGSIVFAHNGIIANDDKFGKYEVDSMSLIHGIRKRNFSEYEGSIALVWIENGLLHAFRHDNPLYRGRIGDTVYLASEEEHLKAVGCSHIKELAENRVYTFKAGQSPIVTQVPVNQTRYMSVPGYGYEAYLDAIQWREKLNPITNQKEWIKDVEKIDEDFSTYKDERGSINIGQETECSRCGCVDLMEDWCLNCGYHPDGKQADEETLKIARNIHSV